MDDLTPPHWGAADLLPVEQCDRDAAASCYTPGHTREAILEGLRDEDDDVQAFARHRLAERERCAAYHDDQAENARVRYEELNRWSDCADERAGWRSWKDANDRHRYYAAVLRNPLAIPPDPNA